MIWLLIAVPFVYVPGRWRLAEQTADGIRPSALEHRASPVTMRWVWEPDREGGMTLQDGTRVFDHHFRSWPLTLTAQGLVVLLGAGVFVWGLQRERRRRAALG